MISFSKQEIQRLATLSALNFKEEELDSFAKEFESIVGFVQKIVDAKIDEKKLEERTVEFDDLREDSAEESLPQSEVLLNSPKSKSGSFCVPKMME
ncbi:MAG: Asp-tRNA(Asn)/Glu-tRNA(Gln) amidotransferase subunit GatC [Clostridia bacterium]